ncbi:MAG: DUF2461 domain-containing protein [Ignavibacteriales bacterium]|nr:DUF2461 domain-containing protein [Ignavibacteriales bacterium]
MDFKKIIQFLSDLNKNNNKDWFQSNKASYQYAKDEFEQFIDILIPLLKEVDEDIDVESSKECIFRIFRDVRFSKNKSPYKTNFGALIAKGGRKSKHAGYYLHIEPNKSFIGGGIYMPPSEILIAIRTHIYENIKDFNAIIHKKSFKKYFPEIYGEKLITAPKGFPKDFKYIELLKHKHYAVTYDVKDSFWLSPDLFEKIIYVFHEQYKFNHFLNQAIK